MTQTLPDVDHILNGSKALEQRMYPEVISEFNAYLSTASKDEDQSGVETCTKVAQAHAYIALAMLDGSPASYRSPEEIERVQRRLNESLRSGQRAGGGVQVVAWASVLWQIVCEDYYKADGMNPPLLAAPQGGRPPSADTAEHIARLIADLDDLSVTLLISHVARSRGDTWRALEERAQPLNLVDPDDDENPEPTAADPTRAERVRKYFTQTPDKVENTRAIVGACATAALILLGIIVGGFTLVLFFVGAVASGRWTYHRLREYQQYLKDFAAAEPKPSDQEMDAWLVEDMEYIRRRAANRLRLNAKLKSEGKGGDLVFPAQIVVGVWEFDASSNLGANGSALTHTQHGSDGKMRADYYKVLILFLTDKLISTFGGLLDFKTGDLLVDWAREFDYRDIVERLLDPQRAVEPVGEGAPVRWRAQQRLAPASLPAHAHGGQSARGDNRLHGPHGDRRRRGRLVAERLRPAHRPADGACPAQHRADGIRARGLSVRGRRASGRAAHRRIRGDLHVLTVHAAESVIALEVVGRMPLEVVADRLVSRARGGGHPADQTARFVSGSAVLDQGEVPHGRFVAPVHGWILLSRLGQLDPGCARRSGMAPKI